MVNKARMSAWLVTGLVAAPLAACGDGEEQADDGDRRQRAAAPVVGNFVGAASGSEMFVAVVTAPVPNAEGEREATVYVSDGKGLDEWMPGTVTGDGFEVKAKDGRATGAGKLTRDAATGTLKLSSSETVEFEAQRATGGAGLYDLVVSPGGKLSGASASGVGLTGTVEPERPSTGRLKLADGRQGKFRVTGLDAVPDGLRAGQLRLIVLVDGQLKGAGLGRAAGGDERAAFAVRSSTPAT